MFWNALLLALREIRRNVLRSILTILGVVIGVAAVIVMVTLGNGATQAVASQIESLGSNLLMIRMGQHMGPGQSSSAPPFSVEDAEALARDIPAVRILAPSASDAVTAIAGNSNWSTTINGDGQSVLRRSQLDPGERETLYRRGPALRPGRLRHRGDGARRSSSAGTILSGSAFG